jgi:hypothetical protein
MVRVIRVVVFAVWAGLFAAISMPSHAQQPGALKGAPSFSFPGTPDHLRNRNIPVLLGVTFDATDPGKVPLNVGTFINFWAKDGFGHPVEAGPDYAGELDNFDLSGQTGIDHTSIDALDRFHQFVIQKLEKLTGQ